MSDINLLKIYDKYLEFCKDTIDYKTLILTNELDNSN